MIYQLNDSHSSYLQIIVTGVVEKTSLLDAMSALMRHPDYHHKHSLWDFSCATTMGLSMDDMKELVGILKLFKTEDKAFANKAAMLIPDHLHQAMATIFVSLSTLLPFEYKIFQTREAAINFLVPRVSPT